MRSRDKSGRLFYPILQTAGFAGFFRRRAQFRKYLLLFLIAGLNCVFKLGS
jgi:hypothetical protein